MEKEHTYSWGEGVFTLLSWFKTEKVKNSKVLVVGAGALGNEVVKNLALFGVGNIVVVDFDTIELSNLTRSVLFREEDAINESFKAEVVAKRAMEINPQINVMPICGDLSTDVGLGLYKEMDVIIACLDSRYARYLLNAMAFRAGKPWVDGAIENLDGTVRVFKPGVNCYECGLTAAEFDNIMLKTGCADVVKTNFSHGRIATTPVSASIIGAVEVQEALKLIHEDGDDKHLKVSLLGKMFKYEGERAVSKIFKFEAYNSDCPAHEDWTNTTEIADLSADTKIEDVLTILKQSLNVEQAEINMRNNKFVEKIITKTDEKEFSVMLPLSQVEKFIDNHKELSVLRYKDILFQKFYENIDDYFPYKELSLREIGIPYFDILQVSTEKGIFYVTLAKDKVRFKEILK